MGGAEGTGRVEEAGPGQGCCGAGGRAGAGVAEGPGAGAGRARAEAARGAGRPGRGLRGPVREGGRFGAGARRFGEVVSWGRAAAAAVHPPPWRGPCEDWGRLTIVLGFSKC